MPTSTPMAITIDYEVTLDVTKVSDIEDEAPPDEPGEPDPGA